jgi:Uma2 family endonuclease
VSVAHEHHSEGTHERAGEGVHAGPWTVADLLAMPENGIRYEVVDGALIVNPPPALGHQTCSRRLANLIEVAARAAGAPSCIAEGIGVKFADDRMAVPDVSVIDVGAANARRTVFQSGEVQVAVEIVSPGSRTIDRALPQMYAEAGVRHFWRVEMAHYRGRTQPLPVLLAYELDEGAGEYRLTHEVGAGSVARLDKPFPVEFDPATLTD